MVSTNGQVSFAAFIYDNPGVTALDGSNNINLQVGFDAGGEGRGANVGRILLNNNLTLEAVNIFRIDGIRVIATALLGSTVDHRGCPKYHLV